MRLRFIATCRAQDLITRPLIRAADHFFQNIECITMAMPSSLKQLRYRDMKKFDIHALPDNNWPTTCFPFGQPTIIEGIDLRD
jgi:hypothetical protein